MPRIDITFILLATFCLTGGMALGIGMGLAHDFQYAPVHAHLNLLGWASLALFGLIYKSYPALAESRLAAIHLVLSGPSGFLFPIGIYLAIAHDSPLLGVIGAFSAFGGLLVFLANLLRIFFFSSRTAAAPLKAPPTEEAAA